MNGTISEKQKYLVGLLALRDYWFHVSFEFLEERGEESRATQADILKSLPVRAHDSCNANDFRVWSVSIHGKAVTDFIMAHMPWDATKTEYREAAVGVIGLYDRSNIHQGLFVLICTTEIMERALVTRITIRSCIVNSSDKGYSPAWT